MSTFFNLNRQHHPPLTQTQQYRHSTNTKSQPSPKDKAVQNISSILNHVLRLHYFWSIQKIKNHCFDEGRADFERQSFGKRERKITAEKIPIRQRARTLDPYAQYSRARLLNGIFDKLKIKRDLQTSISEYNTSNLEERIRVMENIIKEHLTEKQSKSRNLDKQIYQQLLSELLRLKTQLKKRKKQTQQAELENPNSNASPEKNILQGLVPSFSSTFPNLRKIQSQNQSIKNEKRKSIPESTDQKRKQIHENTDDKRKAEKQSPVTNENRNILNQNIPPQIIIQQPINIIHNPVTIQHNINNFNPPVVPPRVQEPTFRISQTNGFAPRSVQKVVPAHHPIKSIEKMHSSPFKFSHKITIGPPKPPYKPAISSVNVNFPPPKNIEEKKNLGEKIKHSPKQQKKVRFLISPPKNDQEEVQKILETRKQPKVEAKKIEASEKKGRKIHVVSTVDDFCSQCGRICKCGKKKN